MVCIANLLVRIYTCMRLKRSKRFPLQVEGCLEHSQYVRVVPAVPYSHHRAATAAAPLASLLVLSVLLLPVGKGCHEPACHARGTVYPLHSSASTADTAACYSQQSAVYVPHRARRHHAVARCTTPSPCFMMSAHLLDAVCRADQGCTMQCIALSGASTITGADVVRLCYAAWAGGKTIAHGHLPATMPRCLYVYSSFIICTKVKLMFAMLQKHLIAHNPSKSGILHPPQHVKLCL
jgi:hypothetical protein